MLYFVYSKTEYVVELTKDTPVDSLVDTVQEADALFGKGV